MKVKALGDQACDFVPGKWVTAGQVVDVPETQGDGTPLIWAPEYWEVVVAEKPAKSAKKEG